MRAVGFVLVCVAFTGQALRGSPNEVNRGPTSGDTREGKLSKALRALLASADPAAAWQFPGAGHSLKHTSFRQPRSLRSPWRVGRLVAQGDDAEDDEWKEPENPFAFPKNPFLEEIEEEGDFFYMKDMAELERDAKEKTKEKEMASAPAKLEPSELEGLETQSATAFPANPFLDDVRDEDDSGDYLKKLLEKAVEKKTWDDDDGPRATSHAPPKGESGPAMVTADTTERRRKKMEEMQEDSVVGALGTSYDTFEVEEKAPPPPVQQSVSLAGGYFDGLLLNALADMPKQALVDFVRQLAERRRHEVAEALALVPPKARKLAVEEEVDEMDVGLQVPGAPLIPKELLNKNFSIDDSGKQAEKALAFGATPDEYYEELEQSEDRKKKRKEVQEDLREALWEKANVADIDLNKRKVVDYNIERKKGLYSGRDFWDKEYTNEYDWGKETSEEIETMYTEKANRSDAKDDAEEVAAAAQATLSMGGSGNSGDISRSKSENLTRAFGSQADGFIGLVETPLPEQGLMSSKGKETFDWDVQMESLMRMRDGMSKEEWEYLWQNEEDAEYF